MNARILLLLVSACGPTGLGDNPPYYDEGATAPVINGVSPDEERGNVGGQTLTIQGAHFGDDAGQIMVVFGGRNAKVLSVSDSEIVVEAPHGPIEGGPVDITVGTPDGQATLDDGYTYEVDEITDGQTAYVMVSEYSFAGDYTFDGGAEFYEIAYPRVHTPVVGYWGASDTAGEWKLEIPDTALYAEWVDDLRTDIGDSFTLYNPGWKGEEYCYRPTYDFTYTGGTADGEILDAYTIGGVVRGGDSCDEPDEKLNYQLSTVKFCKEPAALVRAPAYRADWPLVDDEGYSFDPIGSEDDDDAAAEVVLDLGGEDGDIHLILPERFALRGTQGFQVSGDEENEPLWGGYGVNTCFDADGDGNTTLDETALRWEWAPSELDEDALLEEARALNQDGGVIKDVRVYVNASLIYGAFSWLGLEGYSARATLEVNDGAGALEVPAWVLYEFPSINTNFGGTRLSNPATVNYAYLLLSVSRVVEYHIETSKGDVVFAFVNAELGASGWANPRDQDGCGDCLDNDGDGWTDDEDPDCLRDGTEEVGYSDYTCNDGQDNDGDDKIDREDSVCEDATDGEDNCSDGRDNDNDGYEDDEDCECIAGLSESGETVDLGCCNEADDDGDGWTDRDDPDCETGEDELGYGADACNNGSDDDGDGLIDAGDPYCAEKGADGTVEAPVGRDGCADGADDDGDGYTDLNDPGCEYPNFDAEDSEPDASEDLVLTCYDGLDNDGDTFSDAQDPDCALSDGTPNGFQAEDGEL